MHRHGDRAAVRGDFHVVFAVEALHLGAAVLARHGLCVRAPHPAEEVLYHAVGRLGRKVIAHKAAVIVVLARRHVAQRREGRIAVHDVPVDDALHRRVAEPHRVDVLDQLGLNLLVLGVVRVGRDGQLGDLQRAAQSGVIVHHVVQAARVVVDRRLLRLVLAAVEHVILHAD